MNYILVIDDDPASIGMARIALQMSGWDVVSVSNAHEISGELRRDRPNLILMATHITGVSGCSICQLLKNSPQFQQIPIIMISGEPIPPQDFLMCGADDFLMKPMLMSELVDKASQLLKTSVVLV